MARPIRAFLIDGAVYGDEQESWLLETLAFLVFPSFLVASVSWNPGSFLLNFKPYAMLQEAGKYTLEMLGYGWKPDAATYVALVDSYLKAQKADEMRQLLVKLKEKGFVADDKAARQHMKSMGRFNRGVMDMLFGQYKKHLKGLQCSSIIIPLILVSLAQVLHLVNALREFP